MPVTPRRPARRASAAGLLIALVALGAGTAVFIMSRDKGGAEVATPPASPPASGSWTLAYDQEFNSGSSPDLTWSPKFWWDGDTFWPTHELQAYRQASGIVSDGNMVLTAQKCSCTLTNFNGSTTDSDGEPFRWTSGFESTGGIRGSAPVGFAQRYGYFEARIKMPPAAQGFFPAFWLEGVHGSTGQLASSYHDGSEIDIVEIHGSDPHAVQMHLHGAAEFGASYQSPAAVMSGDYHTFGLDWEPGSVTWYYDESPVARYNGTAYDNQPPHYVLLNFAVGGANSRAGAPNSSTPSSASMSIDYVRVWHH